MGKKLYNEDYINQTALEIQKKLGVSRKFKLQEFSELVSKIGEPPEKDVNFYDYDGTRIASMTIDELQEATSLPDLPQHEGLTNQGWNWTLSQLKELKSPCNVGCNYIPDDGKTKLKIEIKVDNYELALYFATTVAGAGTIDWGDGSDPEASLNDTNNNVYYHTYVESGSYTITVSVSSGYLHLGISGWTRQIIDSRYTTDRFYPSKNILKEINLGQNTILTQNCLAYSCGFERISIPLTGVICYDAGWRAEYTFAGCYKLKCLILPQGLTSHGKLRWLDNTNLKVLSIGYGTTLFNWNTGYPIQNMTSLCVNNLFWKDNAKGIKTLTINYDIDSSTASIWNDVPRSDTAGDSVINLYLPKQTSVIPLYPSNASADDITAYNNRSKYLIVHVPEDIYEDWIAESSWAGSNATIVKI